MARFAAKPASRKYQLVIACIALLGVALVADFLRASSSASFSSPSWSTSIDLSLGQIVGAAPPNIQQTKKKGKKPDRTSTLKDFNATFTDLPAPQLKWEEMAEAPVPRLDGAAIQIKDLLYVFAGYGTIDYVVYSNVYMLDGGLKWKELPPMPKPDSHIEFTWAIVNNSIIIVGGTTEKHPVTKKMVLVGEVFRFNLDKLEWSVIGRMPFRIKTTLVGWLYFTSGQRDKGLDDPSPKKVVGSMWRTKLGL